MDAIILAGGQGSRMQDVLPKALVPARGKPIIAHQLDYLLNSGVVDRIIVSLGVKAELIVDYIKAHYGDKNVGWVIENEPLGTGGGLKLAMQETSAEKVLVFNCDDITDIDLAKLQTYTEHHICAAHPTLRFGLLLEDDEGYIVFKEKPVLNDWVNVGWYLFIRNQIFDLLPENGSLEYDVFPQIKLRMHKHEGFWRPLNNKKDIKIFEESALPSSLDF